MFVSYPLVLNGCFRWHNSHAHLENTGLVWRKDVDSSTGHIAFGLRFCINPSTRIVRKYLHGLLNTVRYMFYPWLRKVSASERRCRCVSAKKNSSALAMELRLSCINSSMCNVTNDNGFSYWRLLCSAIDRKWVLNIYKLEYTQPLQSSDILKRSKYIHIFEYWSKLYWNLLFGGQLLCRYANSTMWSPGFALSDKERTIDMVEIFSHQLPERWLPGVDQIIILNCSSEKYKQ